MTEEKGEYKVTKVQPTVGQRFTSMVVKEFGSQVGALALTPYQQKLASHLFVGIDNQLRNLEAKNQDKGKNAMAPIVWQNINMNKLALDAVHRIELGLDALIPNHIHPIPYWNKRLNKYDLDLRIGYAGKDCYRRKMALDEPVDIIYELVYSKDKFTPIKKSAAAEVESYEFEVSNPFDRGDVIGGFGYIIFDDPRKNKLVLVSKADFDKSKSKAQSDTFWKGHPAEMMFKTLVHRVTSKIPIDPEKVNASMQAVEMQEAEETADRDIEENA
ncbi:MAG: recombinase RecT, partial [Gammaproteobacteria bacterium]|nr:recombinase RecT [Gammaproteobacteria bacterium]